MAKEKKIVNITGEDEKTGEKFGKDKHGKIIKLEDKGDSEKRANQKRIIAVILWVIAIFFEVIGILRLNGTIDWFSNLSTTTFLIICIILDLLFFVPGSLFWKKANHIDPASEKNKTKFWVTNNLGTILSVLAFLPLIIFVLVNKDLDKKDKTIVSVVAIIALLIAGVSSYDFNPVSSEQLAQAEAEVEAVGKQGEDGKYYVYWAPHSKKYHVDPDCPAFSQSETVYEGTVKQAFEKNLTDPCRRCIPELHEHGDEK
ncbi:MAG: hypothetical protein IKD77_01140 [Bacilli bacterium]|nr:hypothetical protein [Bacilli bacterium]